MIVNAREKRKVHFEKEKDSGLEAFLHSIVISWNYVLIFGRSVAAHGNEKVLVGCEKWHRRMPNQYYYFFLLFHPSCKMTKRKV